MTNDSIFYILIVSLTFVSFAMMKKMILAFTASVITLSMFVWMGSAVFTKDNQYKNPTNEWGSSNIDVIWSWAWQQDAFVNVIKWAINWMLGILALIALIILLYGGFQMVTSAGDEDKYTSWFTILKHAATGLILIGIAWFIVSIIFWLVNLLTWSSAGSSAWTWWA